MSDEHDSWFSNVFGVDLGGAAQRIQNEAKQLASQAVNTVTQAVQDARTAVGEVIADPIGAVSGVAKKVAAAAGGGGAGGGGLRAGGPAAGGGTGSFPLSGSVGRGGQNAPNDVKAVQRALGISDDGQCGGGTIAAIENFQRQIGQSKPDGRVDAGGQTERALSSGGKGAAASKGAASGAAGGDPTEDFLDQVLSGAKGLAGAVAGGLGGGLTGGLGGLAGGLPGKVIEIGKDIGGGLAGGVAGGLAGGLPGLGDPGGLLGGAQANLGDVFDTKSKTKEALVDESLALLDVYGKKLEIPAQQALRELEELDKQLDGLPAFGEQLVLRPGFGMALAARLGFASREQALRSEPTQKAFDARFAKMQKELDEAAPILRDYEAAIQKWSDKTEEHRRKAVELSRQVDALQSGLTKVNDESHKLNDKIIEYNKSLKAKVHGQLQVVIIKDLGLDKHRLILSGYSQKFSKNGAALKEEQDEAADFAKDLKEGQDKLPTITFVPKPPKPKPKPKRR